MGNERKSAARPVSKAATIGVFRRVLRKYSLQFGIVFVAVIIWLLFLIGSPRTFLSGEIYISFMSTTPYFALMALPITLIIIIGEIDMSFPSIMALGMMAFDVIFVATGSVSLGFIACILAGAIAGCFNGIIIVKIGIPSLVATIGTQFLWRGVVLVVTNGAGLGLAKIQETIFFPLFVGRIGGLIPAQFVWTIASGIILWIALNRTKFGAHVYLTGDNIESARLMGVNVDKTKIVCFTIVGVAAALAGFVVSEEVLFFWPTIGDGYMLSTLASVFLGGTSAYGGSGTIFGTFIGCYIIGAINAGIVAAGLTGFWTNVIYGLIILVSVALQSQLNKRMKW